MCRGTTRQQKKAQAKVSISRLRLGFFSSFSKSRPKTLAILRRFKECLDHFSREVIAIRRIQLVEPEIEAGLIRITPQEPEVLHQHKHLIEFGCPECGLLRDLAQDRSARLGAVVQTIHQLVSFAQSEADGGVRDERVYVLLVRKASIRINELWP